LRIDNAALSMDDDTYTWHEAASWTCASGVTCFAATRNGSHGCVGWAGKEIAIYDVATRQAVHSAKPPAKDWLGMYVNIVSSCAAFVPGSSSPGTLVLVGGDHQLRLFDFRAQRRAVRQMQLGDRGLVTAVAVHAGGTTAAAGNARGQMLHWDIGSGKCLGAFKGCTGAVKAMDMHPSLPLMTATGLDRHVRVYTTATRSLLAAIYVKQACNCVAFAEELPSSAVLVDTCKEEMPAEHGEAAAMEHGKPARKRKNKRTTAMITAMSRDAANLAAGGREQRSVAPLRKIRSSKKHKTMDLQIGITYDE